MNDLLKVSTLDLIKELRKRKDQEIEIVLNSKFGGYGLSSEVGKRLKPNYENLDNRSKLEMTGNYSRNRSNRTLIRNIKELDAESIDNESLVIETIYVSDIFDFIHDYDGRESITKNSNGGMNTQIIDII